MTNGAMPKISDILGYPAIDVHSHLNHGVPGDRTDIVSKEQLYTHLGNLDFLKSEYDNVGILCGAFSSYASLLTDDKICEENKYLAELRDKYDFVYQWAVVHPMQDETFEDAANLLKSNKVLGIKIHPTLHKYDILNFADKIFSFANELGTTVLMHPMAISKMPSFADKYPKMNLIIAHLGSDTFIDAVRTAKNQNIYVDTSGGASNQNNIIERAVEKIGAEHILFGTDTYSSAFQLGRIAWARIPDRDKKLILRDNAIRLFPSCFGKFDI